MNSNNYNYLYIVVIPKLHKNPLKFRTVTIMCNAYTNNANNLLLTILTKLYDVTIQQHNKHRIKNRFQLVDNIKKLNNINNVKTFDFNDLV